MQTSGFSDTEGLSFLLSSEKSLQLKKKKKIDYDRSLSSLAWLFMVLVNCAGLVATALL